MINSFKHKGLKKFFIKGDLSGIQANHAERLSDRLAFLNVAVCIEDMRKPGYRLHELTGDLKGRWSISVSGNWRMTFEFEDGDAYIVDYEDYH
ncbi:type II toxin-antitoxin system RelE/ParE family toxin [Methyloprofundus sp.]|uniref:type II toxin-antitoxin system RelE/ParE family toxin n=1 Tax=Methyloprofundus sp. TaxID=2020875 RepID=UPI003D0B5414